jgi:uncharacterized Ntn-hydrolase superfamily protein
MYSIVAADPSAGEVGCAVQSTYFAIGASRSGSVKLTDAF